MQGDSMATAPSRWVHIVDSSFWTYTWMCTCVFNCVIVDVLLQYQGAAERAFRAFHHLHERRHDDECLVGPGKVKSSIPRVCMCAVQIKVCHVTFVDCVGFFCLRKWRPPETDEQRQEKKQKAEEAKRRKKDKGESVKKEWCWIAKTRFAFLFAKTCSNTLGLDPQRNGLFVAWRRLRSDLHAFCSVTCVSSSLQLWWF